MKLKQLQESIHDKGLFKAVFIGGLPGAGKSTILSKITDGSISPRIVNTDKGYEFLLKQHNKQATELTWELFGAQSKQIAQEQLFHYINGMLPLMIDGTSSNPSSIVKRMGLLQSIGYDVMFIWVNTNLETCINRMRQRERKVSEDFIRRTYDKIEQIKQFLSSQLNNKFVEVDNNNDNFSNIEQQIYVNVQKFFTDSVNNIIGQEHINDLNQTDEYYLTPNIYTSDYMKRLLTVWYQK